VAASNANTWLEVGEAGTVARSNALMVAALGVAFAAYNRFVRPTRAAEVSRHEGPLRNCRMVRLVTRFNGFEMVSSGEACKALSEEGDRNL
jgi:hypothetical protein